MQMGQKILMMCFRTGLMNTKNELLSWIPPNANSAMDTKCTAFPRGLQECINTEILGTGKLAFPLGDRFRCNQSCYWHCVNE